MAAYLDEVAEANADVAPLARAGNGAFVSLGNGDRMEVQAIREVFGDNIPPISGTKSLTGHSQGATGVHEAIYSLLMMKHGFLAKSAHIDELDPEFEGMPILRERVDNAKIDRVLSNSFGFGGTNACLAFQRVTD